MMKAQGRGAAPWMVMGVLATLHCCSLLASSVIHTVGGSQGWTIGPNYVTWAASQTFSTGDVLFFPYPAGAHNVVEVDKAGHDACVATNPIATNTAGNTNISLPLAGSYYFMCSFPSHCNSGMSLAVTVGAGHAPAPAPNTSVGTPPPTPAPAATPAVLVPPVTSPTPAPTPTRTPTSTPSPTPAPTPLSPSPASTPTPLSSPASTPTVGSTSSPPAQVETPTGTPPPSSAPSLRGAASVSAVLLSLFAAFLVF